LFQGPIFDGSCIVTKSAARLFNLQVGHEITVKVAKGEEKLTVEYIVQPEFRFTRYESSLIIVELPWMQNFIVQPNKINNIYVTLKNPEFFYDTQNLGVTTDNLQEVGSVIQNRIGFEYEIQLPRLQQMESVGDQNDFLNMTFYFIIFFSILITGILINSILTTSIEERIREFGVLRVLGAKRSFTFKMVLLSGFTMGTTGTLLGTLIGGILGAPFLDWFFQNIYTVTWNLTSIDFIILPRTIIRSLIIGFSSSILISIIPAIKARSISLVNAIDPSRTASLKENTYHLKKEGSADFKIMGIGLGVAISGITIFLILPRALTGSGGTSIMDYILVGLLLLVLIGLVLVTLGIVPLMERLIAQIFKPFIKKYYPVYRINLVRYRRRNLGSILMFAMTFSFIIFISTSLEMQTANSAKIFEFQYGSDLVLSNLGTFDEDNLVKKELLDELKTIPGITEVAPINTNSLLDFTKLLSVVFQAGEEGIEAVDFSILFGTLPKYESYIGDLGNYQNYYCSLLGIDESYYDTIDHSLLLWDRQTGSSADAIDEVVNSRNKCIIAKSFADALQIKSLPAEIKITMVDPANNNGYQNISVFEVVGVSKGMPGMWNFRSSQLSLYTGGGILLNMEDYSQLMNWGDPADEKYVLDKILINLRDNSLENLEKMQDYLINYYGEEYDFLIDEATSKIEFIENTNQTTNIIMQSILFFSILVSLFGLIASMYSTILERMFELGILRTMGLKPREVRYMLMAEAITIMLSSGILGGIAGWFIAYMLQTNVAIITELPASTAVDPFTILATFGISVAISIVGMYLITRRVEKMQVIEVLRASF
jgi:ABC-type antimicrobial peptide transport system permease subunit